MIDYWIEKYDPKCRLYTNRIVLTEFYKIISACGLAVFVPQKCHGSQRCQRYGVVEACSISTNINPV